MRCNICTSSTTACAVWCVAVVGSSALLLSAHAVLEREAVWPADCSGMGDKSLLASAWVREAWSGWLARPPSVASSVSVCAGCVCRIAYVAYILSYMGKDSSDETLSDDTEM